MGFNLGRGLKGAAGLLAATGAKEYMMEKENDLALQRAQMMEEFRANLQDRRASTEGTKEYEELQGLKSKNEAGRVALGEAKDAAAIKDIARGQDSQFADGSYGVVGGDGKIRMVRKDGSLIDSATDDTGAAIGKSREEFLKSLETPKDRAERELRESQKTSYESHAKYYDKLGEAATVRADKYNSGGGGSADKLAFEELKLQLNPINKRIENIQEGIDKGTIADPKAAQATIAQLEQQRDRLLFRYQRGGDMSPTQEDISGLVSGYKTKGAAAIAHFDSFFGKGEAEKILSGKSKEIAPNGIDGMPSKAADSGMIGSATKTAASPSASQAGIPDEIKPIYSGRGTQSISAYTYGGRRYSTLKEAMAAKESMDSKYRSNNFD